MISILPHHPFMYDTEVWATTVLNNQLITVDDPTLKYQFVKPFPTFPYRVGDKIVIEKITGSLGNGMANRILQRMLTAYGIPYTKANANNPKISVRETNVISGTHQTIKYYRYERPNGDTTLPFQWCEKVIGIETTGLSLTNYAYPRPVISQTMNIQAFKYLYNVNNPNDLIANASNNVLDADVQNKLLLKTPYTGYTLTSCTAVNPCSDKQPIDLIIALDGSSAISAEEFVAELKMASDVIEQLPVGRGTIRVGFVMYSSNTTSFELYEYASVEEAKGKIKGMKKPNGKNDIKKGFDAVKNILSNSAAVRGKGVPKVLVLVTASHPDDDDASIYAAVDSVHELGVNIAVIGVHTVNGYTDENLEYFATDPVTRNVFKVGTFEMSDIIRKLVTETCKLPAKVNQEPVLPTSVFAGTTVNLEYVTSNQTYDLVLQGNGAVLIRMYYFPDERIPTTYDYDLFEYCVENCVIPIPAISMDFMTPIVRRDGDEMVVPEGKRVVVSVEYLGTPARSDTPQDFTFTVAPHDSSKIKLQPTAQPFSPASADELAEGDAAFEEDFGNHETDEVEVPVIGSTGVFVVIAAACGALLLAGAVVAVFMLRRKVEQTTTDAPAPRLDTIVTTPEVESEAIKVCN